MLCIGVFDVLLTFDRPDADEQRVLDRITVLRHELRHLVVVRPRRWTGLLARITRARALRGSNSIEGIEVTAADAIAAIDGAEPAAADPQTWRAVVGYREAMDFILQRSRDPGFRFSVDTLLAIHFMICRHDLGANPGSFRPGWVAVRDSVTGEIVHEGVDRDHLERLVEELVATMNADDDAPVLIKAAMAHLNLAILHPFSDGNGRAARCLQTAVLAKEGIVAPVFSSIEEYIGRHQRAYYDVLGEVGGGRWQPPRDCRPWFRFCLVAHFSQAQTLVRRVQETERVYDELLHVTARRGVMERAALALLEAVMEGTVRNASYRVSADLSLNLASRDLRALVDAGLLVARGERRGRHYVAGDAIQAVANRHRLPRRDIDPFTDPAALVDQPSRLE